MKDVKECYPQRVEAASSTRRVQVLVSDRAVLTLSCIISGWELWSSGGWICDSPVLNYPLGDEIMLAVTAFKKHCDNSGKIGLRQLSLEKGGDCGSACMGFFHSNSQQNPEIAPIMKVISFSSSSITLTF